MTAVAMMAYLLLPDSKDHEKQRRDRAFGNGERRVHQWLDHGSSRGFSPMASPMITPG